MTGKQLSAFSVILSLGLLAVSCSPEGGGDSGTAPVPSASAPRMEDGAAAYQSGDYQTAMSIFRALAEQGDVRAQYNIGLMLASGQGAQQDFVEAARWYRSAAEQGGVRAQYDLGVLYENGLGVEQNGNEAVRLFGLAANQAHPEAQTKIGEAGLSVADAIALAPLDLSAAAPVQIAQAALPEPPTEIPEDVPAELPVEVIPEAIPEGAPEEITALTPEPITEPINAGPPPLPTEATPLPLAETTTASLNAQQVLAPTDAPAPPAVAGPTMEDAQAAYERADFATAVSSYQILAEQGDARAQYALAVMYANGLGVDQDQGEAIRLYRMAGDQGHAAAQYDLGSVYAAGQGVAQDEVEALRWFRAASNQGHGAATNNYNEISGRFFQTANTAYQSTDYGTAFSGFQLLANLGEAAAQHNLGLMLENGLGVGQNLDEAMRWYRMAADQGFAQSVERLNAP